MPAELPLENLDHSVLCRNVVDDPLALKKVVDELLLRKLRTGEAISGTVSTTSMWPALYPGDRLVVREFRAGELRSGDIVVIQADGAKLVHRLISQQSRQGKLLLVTKGDHNLHADEPWPIEQLVGVVVAVERGGRNRDLRSGTARRSAAFVALLSYCQWLGQRSLPQPFRHITSRGLARLMRLVAC